jgi:hypothetical protein
MVSEDRNRLDGNESGENNGPTAKPIRARRLIRSSRMFWVRHWGMHWRPAIPRRVHMAVAAAGEQRLALRFREPRTISSAAQISGSGTAATAIALRAIGETDRFNCFPRYVHA